MIKTWNRLSIRTQLIILIVLLLSFIQLGTLSLVFWFDKQARQTIATEQSQTLLHSLNHDLLKALLNSDTDTYADISFRISGFKSVKSLVVLNNKGKSVFSYGDPQLSQQTNLHNNKLKNLQLGQLVFTDSGHLLLKTAISVDNYNYGYTLIIIDSTKYKTKAKETLFLILLIFPFELFIGFLIARKISASYTKPFKQLATAMLNNDIANNVFHSVNSQAKNEIGSLFDGYNQMITQIKNTTKEMRFQSEHDNLTGLYNRYAIEKKITAVLSNEKHQNNVLLSIDLDQFKLINDSLGRRAGDELLKMIAFSCSEIIPDNATIARVGGDDFFVLYEAITTAQGLKCAEEILTSLKDFRFIWEGEAISVSASMGLINFKSYEYTLQELIKAVNSAFYTAKSKGRNKLHVYHSRDQQLEQFNTEIKVAAFIKEALKNGPSRFELYAQDIVPLQEDSNKISYEVLIRMFDNQGNFLSPDNFLPTAERYQMMVDIDIFVLTTYLEMVTSEPQHIKKLTSVHINLAGGTLNHPDFQAMLKAAIKHYDFPWQILELEITETSAVGNLSKANDFINYCKEHGIGFALDDFGTGMASFEYLKNLPFDVVKIDGSFVRDMLTDPVDHAMICYTHEICQLRGQKTVAEYVETKADVEELRRIGITYGQGYYLGKPRPLSQWIEESA
ncbi:MAG: EAL domain-containing protein [Pseudomonadota bacterium]